MTAPAPGPAATRGGTQLALTILAVALSVGAYVLVTLGQTGKAPADVGVFIAVLGVAYLVAHLLTVRLAEYDLGGDQLFAGRDVSGVCE